MARIRKKADENLTSQNIEKVISLLESEKPITKKDACAMLNIAYNTTRLNKIIDEYKEDKQRLIDLRKKYRNKPLTDTDINYIISSYLEGISLSDIADGVFRSIALIKRTLTKYHIPLRNSDVDYWNPVDVPVEAMKDDYIPNDLVFSARYNQPASISKEVETGIYRIWLYKDHQYALQPYYELSDLREVQNKFGVQVEDFPVEDIKQLLYDAVSKAKRMK